MGLTRRDLFRLGGLGAAGGVVLPALASVPRLRRRRALPARPSAVEVDGTPTVCGGCGARCAVLGWVKGDSILNLAGNSDAPPGAGRICPRGIAAINRTEDPDRLLRPLRREGPRGAGRFRPATWEAALAELGPALAQRSQTPERGGIAFALGEEDGLAGLALRRLAAALGSAAVWTASPSRPTALAKAATDFWGTADLDFDLASADPLFVFGADPLSSEPFLQRPPGARWRVFDPRCSLAAGAPGSQWLPLRPGGDGAVALALAQVIVERGWWAKDFLRTWARLDLDALPGHLAAWAPEAVGPRVGIPAATLRSLAEEFARSPRAGLVIGPGAVARPGGVEAAGALLLLAALVGAVERPGGVVLPRAVALSQPFPAPQTKAAEPLLPGTEGWPAAAALAALARSERSLDALVTVGGDPVQLEGGGERVAAFLRDPTRVALVVAVTSTLDETAALADWVLPLAPWTERWGLEPAALTPPARSLLLRRPLVAPRGEALGPAEVILRLARSAGGAAAAALPWSDAAHLCEAALLEDEGARSGGMELLLDQGHWAGTGRPLGFARDRLPPNDDEKLRPWLPAVGSAPPGPWSGLGSASPQLDLVLFRSPLLHGPHDAGAKWLAELHSEERVWISSRSAAELGLQDGQPVRVHNAGGSVRGRVFVTEGLQPGCVALALGAGQRAGSRFALGRPFVSPDPDSRRVSWGGELAGDPAQRLAPSVLPELGQVWGGAQVQIEPLERAGRGA